MRIEGDYEEVGEGEQEVNFVNQSGTRYSLKPSSTNASALGVRAVGIRRGSDPCVLVQTGASLQPRTKGAQAISARSTQGLGNGWDPGPPVWDPGIPMQGSHIQRMHSPLGLEGVAPSRHPKAQARGPAKSNLNLFYTLRIQGGDRRTATVGTRTTYPSSPGHYRDSISSTGCVRRNLHHCACTG